MGFVKHAFVLSIYCLLRADSKPIKEVYNWAMKQTVMLAGDSDTNCAIVGGVIGAYAGVDNIDKSKLRKVLECTLSSSHGRGSQRRPKFVQPGQGCLDEMLGLIEMAPSTLEVATNYVN